MRFNYYYGNTPITKEAFENSVPENWQNELNDYLEYHYGYYKAVGDY